MAVGIAQIGHGVERHIADALAEHGMKHQKIVQRAAAKAELSGIMIGGLQREARAVQRVVQSAVAARQGARRCMHQLLAELEILEEIAGAGFHGVSSAATASAIATVRVAISA